MHSRILTQTLPLLFLLIALLQMLERDKHTSVLQATTDTSDSCTLSHTGTSAAAPLAAGIIALVLQAK